MSGSIFDWSTTASNNDSADGDINWTEGQNAKTVNNSARQMMGRVAEILLDIGGQGTVGGAANAITLTLNSTFTGLKSGLICSLKPTADNTGAVTLNVNGIGAKSIRKFDVSGEVALVSGDLQSGNFYSLVYDSSANSAAGAWICLNPTLASVTGPASATDGDIMVADGTTGRAIKDGGSKISDLMPKSGGTFTGGITAPFVTSSLGSFIGSASVAVLGPISAGGGVYLRPEGVNSSTSQVVVTSAGGMVVSGGVTSGQNFVGGANVVLAPNASGGGVFLRPNGAASSTGETRIDSSGNMTINGTLTVTG